MTEARAFADGIGELLGDFVVRFTGRLDFNDQLFRKINIVGVDVGVGVVFDVRDGVFGDHVTLKVLDLLVAIVHDFNDSLTTNEGDAKVNGNANEEDDCGADSSEEFDHGADEVDGVL